MELKLWQDDNNLAARLLQPLLQPLQGCGKVADNGIETVERWYNLAATSIQGCTISTTYSQGSVFIVKGCHNLATTLQGCCTLSFSYCLLRQTNCLHCMSFVLSFNAFGSFIS